MVNQGGCHARRAAFTLQRALLNERALGGENNLPRLLTTRDTLGLATLEGARTAHLDALLARAKYPRNLFDSCCPPACDELGLAREVDQTRKTLTRRLLDFQRSGALQLSHTRRFLGD
jgi:hypothetical protein